jgi:hypothetical protein
MDFRFQRQCKSGTAERSATVPLVLIAAPILIGLGIAIYLRRKQLADRQRESNLTIEPDEILVSACPLPIDEAVGEPQIQSDTPLEAAATDALRSLIPSEPVELVEAPDNNHLRSEFKIPTLIPPLTSVPASKPASTADTPLGDRFSPRRLRTRGRTARRVAAAALSFLVAAAIVYGTLGAVRSHEKKTGPLLFSDATSPPEAEAPAEGPKPETPQSDSPTTPPTEQSAPPMVAEASPPPAAELPSPENALPASQQHQRKHVRHSRPPRHATTVNRKTKTPVPWKVSF